MCGLGGMARADRSGLGPGRAIPESWLDALDAAVTHRGPDGAGRWRHRAQPANAPPIDVAMAHRRLSILDHAGGAQPMVLGGPTGLPAHRCPACGDGALAVVFNGCLYNHRALRRELQALGHDFASDHSDTEVIHHAWRAWGERAFDRLDAMFALALWDDRAGTLVLARDRFGEKPLYVRDGTGVDAGPVVAWSSVAAALRDVPGLGPAALDAPALTSWLVRGYDPDRTPWSGVRALPPGTARAYDLRTGLQHEWPVAPIPWPAGPALVVRPMDPARVGELLEASVLDRLDADVPVACLLSGGIDSSAVTLAAARCRRGHDAAPLRTVCVRMPSARYDESGHARAVAQAIGGLDHHTIDTPGDPAGDLERALGTLALPLGDSSLLPTYWAFRAARDGAKVVLTGDGGDELFMGYDRYTAAENLPLLSALRGFGLMPPVSLLPRRHPKDMGDKLARSLVAATGWGYRDLLDLFPGPDARRLLAGPDERSGRPTDRVLSAAGARRLDVQEHLPGDLLRKVDHASLLAGVEARAPMLSRALSDAVLSRPPERAFRRADRKRALRRYLAGAVPSSVLSRPKMGFAVPVGEWFRPGGRLYPMLRDTLGSGEPFPGLGSAGFTIRPEGVASLIREHEDAGSRSPWPWKGRDHAQRLYALLVMSLWARRAGDPARGIGAAG